MSSTGTTAEATIRWVAETLALSYGTGRDGSRWRLRYGGELWNVEQLVGTWQPRGSMAGYRAAQALAERLH